MAESGLDSSLPRRLNSVRASGQTRLNRSGSAKGTTVGGKATSFGPGIYRHSRCQATLRDSGSGEGDALPTQQAFALSGIPITPLWQLGSTHTTMMLQKVRKNRKDRKWPLRLDTESVIGSAKTPRNGARKGGQFLVSGLLAPPHELGRELAMVWAGTAIPWHGASLPLFEPPTPCGGPLHRASCRQASADCRFAARCANRRKVAWKASSASWRLFRMRVHTPMTMGPCLADQTLERGLVLLPHIQTDQVGVRET